MLEPSREIKNDQTTKINFVDLEKLLNFVVGNFPFEVILSMKTTFEFKNFKIWILKMTSNGKTTNMKVVGIEKLWNFVVNNVLV
jgi:hypothetical protein